MATPPVADLEALLAPIPGDNPAGESLRYASVYDQIKEARRADEALTQGDWQRELKVADWPKVIQLATAVLTTKTKDLQLGAWLTEAWVRHDRLDRLAGLRDGLYLLRGLLEGFWEHLYPEIDPEDDEGPLTARANVLSDLEGRLAVTLKDVPMTQSTAGFNCSYAQWEESKQFDIPENIESLSYDEQSRANELKQRAVAEKRTTSEDWRKAKNATARAFYEDRYALSTQCWEELKALDALVDAQFKREAPGLKALEKSLDEVHTLIERLVKEKRLAEPTPEELEATADAGAPQEQTSDGAVPAGAGSTGPVRNRKEALRRLAEVADYFRATEPHSPVYHLVQRAVRWGEMPLETWLGEVIKDGSVLAQLQDTLGIKPPSE
jgi:type VI secretion system protein ImpA